MISDHQTNLMKNDAIRIFDGSRLFAMLYEAASGNVQYLSSDHPGSWQIAPRRKPLCGAVLFNL